MDPTGSPLPPRGRLFACSPDRTLVRSTDPVTGEPILFKIYETGSLEQARAEAAWSRRLSIAGLARVRRVSTDPWTGRPCVVMDFHEGVDLEQHLALHGPLSPADAAHVVQETARTLAAMHAAGVVHRDVKPANVLLTRPPDSAGDGAWRGVLLADLEHAVPIGSRPGGGGFTGGTRGFAPPEAEQGAAPSPAFDVYGLGTLLFAALTSWPPFAARLDLLAGFPRALRELAADCLCPDPRARPGAEEVATRLEEFLAARSAGDEALDRALAAIQALDLAEAARRLEAAGAARASPRGREIAALLSRRERLARRLTPWTTPAWPERSPERAAFLAELCPVLAAALRRFPRHPEALALRRRVHAETRRVVRDTGPAVRGLVRAARFEEARSLVTAAERALKAESVFPAAPPSHSEDADGGPLPPLACRDPRRFLESVRARLEESARTHAELLERLSRAEADLDVQAAERILAHAAEVYTGASEVVAGLKDRLHRLRFYLERVARAEHAIRALREELEAARIEVDLEPLERLWQRCRTRTDMGAGGESGSETGGRRTAGNLHRTLLDLVADFPAAKGPVGAAIEALQAAMAALTDLVVELLEDARRKLAAVPVPIRPLQGIVSRVDGFLLLDVLVDRPSHGKAEILDLLESVRLRLEQERETRDRIARGAVEAMESGHITTALFDMTRAVRHYAAEAEPETQERLREQLEEARRRKELVDEAAARNMELAARYAQMQDDPEVGFAARNGVLQERSQVLRTLCRHVHGERRELYASDLREVKVAILRELSDHATRELDRRRDPAERVRIARETVTAMEREIQAGAGPPPARAEHILEHWRHELAMAEEALRLERRQTEDAARAGRRRRWKVGAAAAAVLAMAFLAVGELAFSRSTERPLQELARELDGQLAPTFRMTATPSGPRFDRVAACVDLDRMVMDLEQARLGDALPRTAAVVTRARDLVGAINDLADRGPRPDLRGWLRGFRRRLEGYDRALGAARDELHARGDAGHRIWNALRRFRENAHVAGVFLAALAVSSPAERAALRSYLARARDLPAGAAAQALEVLPD